MNLLRGDKATPVVPQRPTSEERNNPITHSLSKENEMGTNLQENNNDEKSSELPKTIQKRTGMMGVMSKVNPFKSSSQVSTASRPPGSEVEEGKVSDTTQNPGMLKGVIQKVNPFKSATQVKKEDRPTDTVDHLATEGFPEGKQNPGGFKGMMQKVNPFKSTAQTQQDSSQEAAAAGSDSLPTAQEGSVEMAAVPVPSEGNPLEWEDDEDGLVDWWRTVEGWEEWTESNNFQEDEGELAVEEAADRVFMAARLFVRFFNRRGGSLQQRILELLSLADAADAFHKKTVKASVGGGVASVAGSITTITGLILAPFTMGTSLIVTAVGIGVATAGGVASASANITDAVHSKTDRKKVEQMIQGYQEEMEDIKACLDFVQTGMETLEEWDFEQYADSISKKYLNQNVKHVMKEGGRAGKALLINTESLIGTVQVLSAAGGAAKAAQVMSVTTGVMSGLFLALDVFFLTKDSIELRKGAKTEFAAKIREVCKDLQNGLLELNKIKEELQKTIDGIEVEVDDDEDEEGDEEKEKEGDEEEEEREEMLKSDLKKLKELEE